MKNSGYWRRYCKYGRNSCAIPTYLHYPPQFPPDYIIHHNTHYHIHSNTYLTPDPKWTYTLSTAIPTFSHNIHHNSYKPSFKKKYHTHLNSCLSRILTHNTHYNTYFFKTLSPHIYNTYDNTYHIKTRIHYLPQNCLFRVIQLTISTTIPT